MPLSSRNFVVSAIPFIPPDRSKGNTVITRHDRARHLARLCKILTDTTTDRTRPTKSTTILSLLVFSSSFLNGSFCPELIMGNYSVRERPSSLVHEGSTHNHNRLFHQELTHRSKGDSEPVPGLTSFCFKNSSTIQFINSVKLHSSSYELDPSRKNGCRAASSSLFQLIAQSRYVIRQLVELHQVTDLSKASNAPLRHLHALRKLTLTVTSSTDGSVDLDNLVNESLAQLRNLEELKILSIVIGDSPQIPSAMLKRIWTIPNNPMRYLTNFEIDLLHETNEIDLSVISDAQPKLQKLRVYVKSAHSAPRNSPTTILPPHLAVLDDLRELSLEIHDVPQPRVEWDQFFHENDERRSSKQDYCPYLTHVTFSLRGIDSGREDTIEHFIEKLDGRFVTHAMFSCFGRIHQEKQQLDHDAVIVLTRKFPRLAKLHLGVRSPYDCLLNPVSRDAALLSRGVLETLKLVGQRLAEGSLMEGLSIDHVAANDEGFQYLFDPQKATGGCYKSLTSLRASPGGSRGKGWFGESLNLNEAFSKKQYVLRSLHLDGNSTFCVEGFNEILLAFSHCLEELTVPVQFSPKEFVPSKEIRRQKMTQLHTLHVKHHVSEYLGNKRQNMITPATFGKLVALCPKLHTLTMSKCGDQYIQRFCNKFIDSESKRTEIDLEGLPDKMLESSWNSLSRLKSLRKVTVEEGRYLSALAAWLNPGDVELELLLSKFRQERPDVCINNSRRY